jgi:hypothetical protein
MIITMASISEKEPDKEQDTLNTTVETILESDDDHSIHQVQATIDNDIVENCEQVSTTALDSDRKPNLPKLVDDIVIDTDNAESHINNYTLNDSDDTQHIDNQAEYDDFDDFGSFDSQIEEDNDDEFDAFDDDIIEEAFDVSSTTKRTYLLLYIDLYNFNRTRQYSTIRPKKLLIHGKMC